MTKKGRGIQSAGRTQLRTLALYQDPQTIETDPEQRVIRGVSLIQAVEALGHGMTSLEMEFQA